ncbi:hypothetical protein B0H11DRAFT_1280458 [Mycena galericulata]|nr:hypothetical protein B0H11DRAFT_1280458 [Mycena galericulata]
MSTSGGPQEIPPDVQRQIQVSSYALAGSTAVLFWDVLNNLRGDYSLLFKQKFNPTTAMYVLSRIASLVYVLGFTIFGTYPLRSCELAYVSIKWFYPVGTSANAFLFYSRVRAIYGGDRRITIVFGILWLAVLGTSLTVPIGGSGIEVTDPHECINGPIKAYVGTSGVAVTLHDTLVFFAISYRLVSTFAGPEQKQTPRDWVKAFLRGTNLPAYAKAVFTDGQMYYMITVISNVVTTSMVYIPVSPVYHAILVIPNFMLTSVMACRVYRNTKLARGNLELSLPTLNPACPSRDHGVALSAVAFGTNSAESAHSEGHVFDCTGNKSNVLSPSSTANISASPSGTDPVLP